MIRNADRITQAHSPPICLFSRLGALPDFTAAIPIIVIYYKVLPLCLIIDDRVPLHILYNHRPTATARVSITNGR